MVPLFFTAAKPPVTRDKNGSDRLKGTAVSSQTAFLFDEALDSHD